MADLSRLPDAPEGRWRPAPTAACRCADHGPLFLPAAERGAAATAREEAAKALCAGCEARVDCRRHALAVREPYGVRGGLTAAERRALFTGGPGAPAPRL
ncbi:WhiB family transcriptional regulator [Kitasatospora sp. NPDC127059]|uniref:WhiB family transcriptional regulator n=1 Tax=unclassified Kitasatospora TaxID=2633591 RepID=UPI003658EE34